MPGSGVVTKSYAQPTGLEDTQLVGAQPCVPGALKEEVGILGPSDDSGWCVGWEAFKGGLLSEDIRGILSEEA